MEPTRANHPTLDVCRFKPSLHLSRPIRSKLNLSKGSAKAGMKLYKEKQNIVAFITLHINLCFLFDDELSTDICALLKRSEKTTTNSTALRRLKLLYSILILVMVVLGGSYCLSG